jgi:hypothetical protein
LRGASKGHASEESSAQNSDLIGGERRGEHRDSARDALHRIGRSRDLVLSKQLARSDLALDDEDQDYNRDLPNYSSQKPARVRGDQSSERAQTPAGRLYNDKQSGGPRMATDPKHIPTRYIDADPSTTHHAVSRYHLAKSSSELPSATGRQQSPADTTVRTANRTQPLDHGTIWSREKADPGNPLRGSTGRKLFNPSIHDPLAFQKNIAPLYPGMTSTGDQMTNPERSQARRGVSISKGDSVDYLHLDEPLDERRRALVATRHGKANPRGAGEGDVYDPLGGRAEAIIAASVDVVGEDLAADKARERRRRKEGSEKGGLGVSGHRKRDEERSRGSRSSEGSESLKDRDRGRGKRLVCFHATQLSSTDILRASCVWQRYWSDAASPGGIQEYTGVGAEPSRFT